MFTVPTLGEPLHITGGPDGNLWFTESYGNKIGQINPTTHAIAEFPVPTASSEPFGISAGPDGNLWFTEDVGNKIGQINPTTHAIAEFPVPTPSAALEGIVTGPDDNLWFTEFGGDRSVGGSLNKIGQIDPTTHAIAEFPLPIYAGPTAITAGPDGNLWFTEPGDNDIGQAVLSAPVTAPDLALSGNAPTTVILGDNVTYTLTVTNNGTANATGATITDTLRSNVTFVSATDGVVPMNGVVTFSVGNLAAGASASFTIVVTPTSAGTATDLATASLNQTDPTPADNSVTLNTTVASPTSPDLALASNAPTSVTLGSNVTYNLTVTNNGTAGATGVTLSDTLPSGVTFVSATGGVTPADGKLNFAIGSLAAGVTTSVTIVVAPTVAGTLTDRASVSMNQTDPTPADNTVTDTTTLTTPSGVDGPTVIKVQRFGYHWRPTTLVLTFDEPLDPGTPQNPDNYQLLALGSVPNVIRIKSAVYDAATRTVTLSPVERLNLHHRFRLTVVGTGPNGVTDTSGNLLDGRKTGKPGSDFVTIITAKDLVLT